MKKKTILPLPVLLLVLMLLPALCMDSAAAEAASVRSGTVRIENRKYSGGTLSFDAGLSGTTGQAGGDAVNGQLAVSVYGEDRRMKDSAFYPAAETVHVTLGNVADTDRVKAVWLDGALCPVAEPVPLLMDGADVTANAQFADNLVNLLGRSGGAGAETADPSDPYALARLIVGCDALPDLDGWNVSEKLPGPDGLWVLQFLSGGDAEKCAKHLQALPGVRYVEPDAVMQADDPPADSAAELADASAHLSWGVDACGVGRYAEWLKKRGVSGGVTVAVVDTGVDLGHPFLAGRLLPGRDILLGNSIPQDRHGHGTHVAGIIADCTAGVDVRILPVRVLDERGQCCSVVLIAAAIRCAADLGADVINLSLSAPAKRCIDDAVAYALSKNITVVSAAGNQYTDTEKRSPARVREGITVTASSQAGQLFTHSNYGDAVDLCAPGVQVRSAYLRESGEEYRTLSGTSMAAPHVSTAAALLLCEYKDWTPAQLSDTLRRAASDMETPGWDRYSGAGLLDMRDFISEWQDGIHALLYDDGELVFQTTEKPADGRTVVESYPVRSAAAGAEYAAWYDRRDDIKKVTIAERIQPESTALWFCGCGNLLEVAGLENLNTSAVTDMSQMFRECQKLTKLDLTGFDTANVTEMGQMFFDCSALKTIYASDKFTTGSVDGSADMFYGCMSLESWQGTKYDRNHIDREYARIDDGPPSPPGYFSPENIPVQSITLSTSRLDIDKGQTGLLTASIQPEDASERAVTWSSDNPSVVDVTGNGRVIAVAGGMANITASCGRKTSACEVHVRIPVTGIQLSGTDVTVKRGGEVRLTASAIPEDATDRTITWRSSNDTIAKVSSANGTAAVITGVQDGVTEITAMSEGEKVTAVCSVHVYTHWSEWSDSTPPDGAESEERTVYRYRDNTKETTESGTPLSDDWTLTGTSWGEWSDWGDTPQYPSDTLDVETREVIDVPAHTEYRYGRWVGATINWCKEYGESLHGGEYHIEYSDWSSSRAEDTGTGWCCGHFDWEHPSHIGVIGPDSRGYPMWEKYKVSGYSNPDFFWEETRYAEETRRIQYRTRHIIYHYERWVKGDWTDWTTEYRSVNPPAQDREEKKQRRYVITT